MLLYHPYCVAMRPKAKMKTLFVFIALVVMHPRAMISSVVKVHMLP